MRLSLGESCQLPQTSHTHPGIAPGFDTIRFPRGGAFLSECGTFFLLGRRPVGTHRQVSRLSARAPCTGFRPRCQQPGDNWNRSATFESCLQPQKRVDSDRLIPVVRLQVRSDWEGNMPQERLKLDIPKPPLPLPRFNHNRAASTATRFGETCSGRIDARILPDLQ